MPSKKRVLLRRGPVTGGVNALTNYSYKMHGTKEILRAASNGKHDVTADFDALVCEFLLDPDCGDIIEQLDGAVRCPDALSKANREEIGRFRIKLMAIIKRHNNSGHGS